MGPLVPGRKAMVKTERELRRLVHGHLMLVLAPQLSERTDSLMNPLVTIDFLAAWDLVGRRWRGR